MNNEKNLPQLPEHLMPFFLASVIKKAERAIEDFEPDDRRDTTLYVTREIDLVDEDDNIFVGDVDIEMQMHYEPSDWSVGYYGGWNTEDDIWYSECVVSAEIYDEEKDDVVEVNYYIPEGKTSF